MIRISASIILLSITLSSCSPKKDIIPISKMKVIVWELIKTDEWVKVLSRKDTLFTNHKVNIQPLLNKNHLTKEALLNSYQYYQNNPSLFKILLDSVYAYGFREKAVQKHITPTQTSIQSQSPHSMLY